MAKRLRLQESHSRRRLPLRDPWVPEPRDIALIGASIAVILYLQWIAHWSVPWLAQAS